MAAILGALFGLWLVWIGIPGLTAPPASEAELRGMPAEAKWQARDSRQRLQNDARTTLLQGIGGLSVLLGAFFTYRQLHVAREGQVTDRFGRAVDHLGHQSMDVRLGGIYALERIANDSSQDRGAVAEVLAAFVRGHAPWPPSQPGQPKRYGPGELPLLQTWAADVQAALTVLGRRKQPNEPPDGLEKWLPSQWVNLVGTDLRRAVLVGAQLDRAILHNAQLYGALLIGSQLRSSSFISAELGQASLKGAHLQQADLSEAGLENADLSHAQLQKARLRNAQLQGANLNSAQLQGADLFGAQLHGATLSGAVLNDTNLRGARLVGAGLDSAHLQGALCNANTVWPAGFDWRAAGVLLDPSSDQEEEKSSQ